MRKANSLLGLVGLSACLGVGLASVTLGTLSLARLAESYQPGDILYSDGPELFQVWLKRRQTGDGLTPQSIARRLLVMPIGARRDTVSAMMGPDFWADMAVSEAERLQLLNVVESGLVEALSTAPSAGDIWLAASKIRSQTVGFDQQAEDYLAASYLMAPREGDLVRSRLVYVTSVEPMLRDSFEDERQRDREMVRDLYPGFDRRYRNWLDGMQKGDGNALVN